MPNIEELNHIHVTVTTKKELYSFLEQRLFKISDFTNTGWQGLEKKE